MKTYTIGKSLVARMKREGNTLEETFEVLRGSYPHLDSDRLLSLIKSVYQSK